MPIQITGSYTVNVDQHQTLGDSGYLLQTNNVVAPTLDIFGRVDVTGDGIVYGIAVDGLSTGLTRIYGGAELHVVAGTNETAYGYVAPGGLGELVNSGLVEVISDGQAVGVYGGDLTNSGEIRVRGAGGAAFWATEDDTFYNTGLITFEALTGAGIGVLANAHLGAFENRGVLSVTDHTAGKDSVALYIDSPGDFLQIINYGMIQADYVYRANLAVSNASSAPVTIDNRGGILRGDIDFLGKLVDGTISNTGLIDGKITFGGAEDYYGGFYGTVTGSIHGGGGADQLGGGLNNDLIYGDDVLEGAGDGADRITGGNGDDRLFGGGGGDSLDGETGNDQLTGGSGADRLIGGAGLDTAYFSGAFANYSLRNNADGTTTVTDLRTGSPDGVDTLSGIERVHFSDREISPRARPGADFGGDGASDLLFRNELTGELVLWAGGDATTASSIGTVGLNFGIRRADLAGDLRTDLIFTSALGQVIAWENGDAAQSRVLGNIGLGWTMAGTGDFDGDGRSDLLFRNVLTNDLVTWRGGDAARSEYMGRLGAVWTPLAADITGDGQVDLVFQHALNGQVVMWDHGSAGAPRNLGSVGTGWLLTTAGDFDGDGRADLVFQNRATGELVAWNGGDATQGWSMGTTNPGAGFLTGDYDADGRADLVVRYQEDLSIWKHGQQSQAAVVAGVGASWDIYGGESDQQVLGYYLQTTTGAELPVLETVEELGAVGAALAEDVSPLTGPRYAPGALDLLAA